MRMLLRMLLSSLVFLVGGAASGATLGVVSDFEMGNGGWVSGGLHPDPPVVMADGGPTGAGDAFLQLTSNGGTGAGSRLVTFNGTADWTGDYASAGIGAIELDVKNLSEAALALRILLRSTAGQAVSDTAVTVDPLADWQRVRIPIGADDLVGALDPAAVVAGVSQIRLIHNPAATTGPLPAISAVVGIDNVTTVPEPGTALLLAGGLVALGALRKTPRRR
jgi:hypothetical protein